MPQADPWTGGGGGPNSIVRTAAVMREAGVIGGLGRELHRQAHALHACALQGVHHADYVFVFDVAVGADHHRAGSRLAACLHALDPAATVQWHYTEGARMAANTPVCEIQADAREARGVVRADAREARSEMPAAPQNNPGTSKP